MRRKMIAMLPAAAACCVTSALVAAPPPVQPLRPQEVEPPAQISEPVVRLLDQGAAPQRELRLAPEAGLKQQVEMVMRMNTTVTMNGMQMPAPAMPAIKTVMIIEVTEVAENGDITSTFETTEAGGADGPLPPMYQGMFDGLVGMSGTTVMTNRGLTRKADMQLPADADPMIRQQVESIEENMTQMSAPFPAEAVGVGAKWEVKQRITSGGITIDQTAVYELVKSNEDVIELAVQISQTAGEQPLNQPGLPPDASITLKSMSSTGSGMLSLLLGHIAPESATMDMDSKVNATMAMQGQSMNFDQAIKTSMATSSQVGEGD